MATVLYKDGETVLVSYDTLQNHLDAGWKLTKKKEGAEIEKKVEETKANEDVYKALRAKAKEAGIKSWHLYGPEKLKELLANVNED